MIGLLVASAIAAETPSCEGTVALGALLDDVGRVEQALADSDRPGAVQAGARLRVGLGCLTQPLDATVAPRLYRAIGAGLLEQQHPEAMGWLQTAALLEPGFRYDLGALPPRHRLFDAWQAAREAAAENPPVRIAERRLAPGEHWLDGRRLERPVLAPKMPHLYQFREASSALVANRLVWGIELPNEALVVDRSAVAAGDATPTGLSVQGAPLAPIPVRPERWPAGRIAALAVGGALIVGGAALYGGSRGIESDGTRQGLAVGAGGLALAGVGTAGFGLFYYMVDAPAFRPRSRR